MGHFSLEFEDFCGVDRIGYADITVPRQVADLHAFVVNLAVDARAQAGRNSDPLGAAHVGGGDGELEGGRRGGG